MDKKTPDFKETIALQKFRSRIQYLQQHLQVIDASLTQTSRALKRSTSQNTSIAKALGLTIETHDKLNHPVKGYERIISYSRSKNVEFSLLELYRSFTEYMHNILSEMYRKEPMKIVQKIAEDSKENKLSFLEIVNLGDYNAISELMVLKVFRKLENERSTPKLLEKVINHTKIELDGTLKKEALMYLQMRHLITHNRGLVDQIFIDEFSEFTSLKVGNKIPTNFATISQAIKTVYELCDTIDKQLVNENLVSKRELVKKSVAEVVI